ncbi:mitochondrial ribosomal protein L37 [Phyllostomus discolor]|uniref:Large ribosomal subunit protein mL37 n=1 Tax=Phyllostomus discolor TaxID=89673 RepID=A0A834EAX6_9CHIR|nr:mitochondrial ribosomal protein L37 [Phyllostomus discolor]
MGPLDAGRTSGASDLRGSPSLLPRRGCTKSLDWSPSPTRRRCTSCPGWRGRSSRPGIPAGGIQSSVAFPRFTNILCTRTRSATPSTSAAASWRALLLQVHGSGGARLNARDPLPPIASREEVEATQNHVLETFYPISPTIGLQECNVYDEKDDTGFQEGYPYPCAHTLFLLEAASVRSYRFPPDQLRAKMIMFAFGSALTQARLLYGNDTKVLEQPVVVQCVGTDGRIFQFLVLQLNTTDLASNEGVKNLVWVDSDQLLYQHFWCLPVIKKKVVVEPVGPTGFQPETFKKFLALYLHGAVGAKEPSEA